MRMSKDEHGDALAANFPTGKLWGAKNRRGSNLRSLIDGLALTFQKMDSLLEKYIEQSIPPETQTYIEEWEEALGIPDDCFRIGQTTAERQFAIEIKLSVLSGVSTSADIEALGVRFGLTIKARSGIEHVVAEGGTETPALTIGGTFADVTEARQTLVITESFPEGVVFPWFFTIAAVPPPPGAGLKFSNIQQEPLRCLIRKLARANVNVIFVEAV